jgi:hypothetical protein
VAGELARQYCEIEHAGNVTFPALRDYLRSSKPIKISSDFIDDTYKELVEGKEIISFEFRNGLSVVDEELEATLAKALCGCLNSANALIQFNILNSSLQPHEEAEKIAKLLDDRLRMRIDPSLDFGYRISDLSHSPTRQWHMVELNSPRLRMVDGSVFVVLGKQVVPAKAADVEQIVSRNLYQRFGKRKQLSLSDTSDKLRMVANSLPALTTAFRIDQLLDRQLFAGFKPHFESPEYSKALADSIEETNGSVSGDFYLLLRAPDLRAGRLEGHYLRFTTPLFPRRDVDLEDTKTVTVPANSILLFPKGGVHYVESDKPIFAPHPLLVLQPDSEQDFAAPRALMGLAAFLKSSFILWYMLTIHEVDDLFDIVLEQLHRFPLPKDPAIFSTIGAHAERIIAAEKTLLKEFARDKLESTAREKVVNKHNRDADHSMRLVDRDVFLALNFTRAEVCEVYRTIQDLRLCDYGVKKDLDEFLKPFAC